MSSTSEPGVLGKFNQVSVGIELSEAQSFDADESFRALGVWIWLVVISLVMVGFGVMRWRLRHGGLS